MAITKKGVDKPAPLSTSDLSKKQIENVVATYIGVHPKYFHYRGLNIEVDVYKMARDGTNWTGFPANHNGHLD